MAKNLGRLTYHSCHNPLRVKHWLSADFRRGKSEFWAPVGATAEGPTIIAIYNGSSFLYMSEELMNKILIKPPVSVYVILIKSCD